MLNVFPNPASGDLPNISLVNTEFSSELRAITIMRAVGLYVAPSDLAHLIFRQKRIGVTFSFGHRSVTALFQAIRHVVIMGAKKQVIRVDTGRIVASVKNEQPVWDRAIMDHIRDAVRQFYDSFAVDGKRHFPVTIAQVAASPEPAEISFRDSSTKTLTEGNVEFAANNGPACYRAETLLGPITGDRKNRLTQFALACYRYFSQGVNLFSGFVLVRPSRMQTHSSGPSSL